VPNDASLASELPMADARPSADDGTIELLSRGR